MALLANAPGEETEATVAAPEKKESVETSQEDVSDVQVNLGFGWSCCPLYNCLQGVMRFFSAIHFSWWALYSDSSAPGGCVSVRRSTGRQ